MKYNEVIMNDNRWLGLSKSDTFTYLSTTQGFPWKGAQAIRYYKLTRDGHTFTE